MTPRALTPTLLAALLAGLRAATPAAPAATPAWLDAYNVAWTEPGAKALHSMPCGGGNIALNVWATKEALLFYIASPDSWDGQTQVKMGRVRISFSPNPFAEDFHQELKLADNSVHVSGRAADGTDVKLRIWVDALQPVVHVEGQSSKPIHAVSALEVIGDAAARFDGDAVAWRFRIDGPSPQRRELIAKNHIETIADAVPDPMANHTWGGRLAGAGFAAGDTGEAENEGVRTRAWRIRTTASVTNIDLRATLRIAPDPTGDAWEMAVAELEERTRDTAAADCARTAAWWREFWDRSHIVISERDEGRGAREDGTSTPDPRPSAAFLIGQNYQLFRAMLAANRTGRMPTLFNGGPFLMEANPNERQWGHAGFTAQNQRLVHWPMLKSGDADLLKVGLDFYADRHQLALAWAKHFWNVDGAVFPEDIDLFGLPVYTTKDGSGHTAPECLRYHYVSGIEFALMMLQSGSYFGSDSSRYVPVADGMLRFFDQFYRQRDQDGRLVIFPGNAVEAYSGTTNDAPTVAGLTALADALLELPAASATAERRAFWRAFRDRLPPVPVRTWKGRRQLAPADGWQAQRPDFNMELPHLYPVFPFRLYGVGLPDLDLARNAWFYGDTCPAKQKNEFCWYQGGIFAAGLGLVEEAREYSLAKFMHPRRGDPVEHDGWKTQRALSPWEPRWTRPDWQLPRYPAFWDGMIFCGRPDMDHGGAAMIQLQEMLLQTPGDNLFLFPAWPRDWDVDFKLHAPQQTTVEGVLRDGKLVVLKVTPESRAKDVVNWLGKVPPVRAPALLSARKSVVASSTYGPPGYDAAKANDDDVMTRWASANEAREGTLTVDLGEDRDIGSVWLCEIEWPFTRTFVIEIRQGEGWKEVVRGTTIGSDLWLKFPPVTAREIRLSVLKADGPININEFQVFGPGL
jgi:hypothetical protein